jgi:hypothetical protein
MLIMGKKRNAGPQKVITEGRSLTPKTGRVIMDGRNTVMRAIRERRELRRKLLGW